MPLEPFIGQIITVPYNFAPRGFAFCQGQVLSIAQNTALFSLLGITYGGNGQTTFGLPNLNGRVAVGKGQGPGLNSVALGEQAGSETVTLTQAQMPAHSHGVQGFALRGNQTTPGGATWARSTTGDTPYATSGGAAMNSAAMQSTGGSQPHSNMMPYLTLNFAIALQGIFPPRP